MNARFDPPAKLFLHPEHGQTRERKDSRPSGQERCGKKSHGQTLVQPPDGASGQRGGKGLRRGCGALNMGEVKVVGDKLARGTLQLATTPPHEPHSLLARSLAKGRIARRK